ncbi:MAG: hypothetical protein INR69_09730 [Mucilaginibacter polytrichastri]|nr:hypothetical protein [Mucilaginibacter polytrichastri]
MSLTDEEERTLKHDIRNQLSNISMTVGELKHITDPDHEYLQFLLQTLDTCCRNIDDMLKKAV